MHVVYSNNKQARKVFRFLVVRSPISLHLMYSSTAQLYNIPKQQNKKTETNKNALFKTNSVIPLPILIVCC